MICSYVSFLFFIKLMTNLWLSSMPYSLLLLVAYVGIFPEQEGMMQHRRDKYFPQL